MFREIRQPAPEKVPNAPSLDPETANSGFLGAVTTIVIADLSMSLDNVLAVAGRSKRKCLSAYCRIGDFHRRHGGHLKLHRQAYALLVGVGLMLTWSANVFEIIN